METKRSFQFEIIINVSASSFRFILIPVLWVYGHYNSCSTGTVCRRQILISKGGAEKRQLQPFDFEQQNGGIL